MSCEDIELDVDYIEWEEWNSKTADMVVKGHCLNEYRHRIDALMPYALIHLERRMIVRLPVSGAREQVNATVAKTVA